MIDLIRKRCVAIDSVIKDLNMEYHAIKSKVLREEYKKWKKDAYSARTAHPFQRNGAPFRFKLSKTQQVD